MNFSTRNDFLSWALKSLSCLQEVLAPSSRFTFEVFGFAAAEY